MRSAVPKPPVPIGGDVPQCRRVVICHSARCGGKGLLVRNADCSRALEDGQTSAMALNAANLIARAANRRYRLRRRATREVRVYALAEDTRRGPVLVKHQP